MRSVPAACLAVCLAIGASIAGPAQAATTVITYVGKVSSSFNLTDMFGTGSYDNLDYSLVYTIDDAAPGAVLVISPNHTGVSGPGVVHAALTVNGVTRTILGPTASLAEQTDDVHVDGAPFSGGYVGAPYAGGFDFVHQKSVDSVITPYAYYHEYSAETYVASYAHNYLATADFRAPFVFAPSGTDSLYSVVQFNDFNYATHHQDNYAFFNLGIEHVQVSRGGAPNPSGAPEPAVWALMLLGFGGAGAMLRRRREVALPL